MQSNMFVTIWYSPAGTGCTQDGQIKAKVNFFYHICRPNCLGRIWVTHAAMHGVTICAILLNVRGYSHDKAAPNTENGKRSMIFAPFHSSLLTEEALKKEMDAVPFDVSVSIVTKRSLDYPLGMAAIRDHYSPCSSRKERETQWQHKCLSQFHENL